MVNDQSDFEGGSSQLFINEVSLLKQKGHKIYTFTLGGRKNNNKYSKTYIICIEPPDKTIFYFFQKYFSFEIYHLFKKIVQDYKPDIIHFHNNIKSTFSFYFVLSKFNIPVVHTLHDANLLCISSVGVNKSNGNLCLKGSLLSCSKNRCLPLTSFIKHALLWKLRQYYEKNKIDIILCPSLFLKSKLIKNGFRNTKLLKNFVKEQSKCKVNKKNYILYCGRLINTKGIISLIKAFELIVKKNLNIKLIIIGDGNERTKLKEYIIKQNMTSKITLLKHKSNSKLGKYYKYASLTILPSIGVENSPMSILESFSYGTPVVASNIGGIPELVKNNITGMLFKPGDYVNLSSKIEYLLTHPQLLIKMRINCLNTINSSYNETVHYNKLMVIYKSILKS